MQFFAFTTLILITYVKYDFIIFMKPAKSRKFYFLLIRKPDLGEAILKNSLIAFTVISLAIHIHYKFAITLDVMDYLLAQVYMVPWVRISPYLMGTWTAIHIQRNGGRLDIATVSRFIHSLRNSEDFWNS